MDKSVTLKGTDRGTFILRMEINMLGNFIKVKLWDLDSSIRMEYALIKDSGLMVNSLGINSKFI